MVPPSSLYYYYYVSYLVRPELSMMRLVARQILASFRQHPRLQFHVFFCPYRTVACEQMLEDEGVLRRADRGRAGAGAGGAGGSIRGDNGTNSGCRDMPKVEIGEFSLGLVPFDADLLSLEIPSVFRECYVDGDTSTLGVVAAALHGLQQLYGTIPHVKSKGAASKKVLQSLLHMRCEADRGGWPGGLRRDDEWDGSSSSSSSSSSSGGGGGNNGGLDGNASGRRCIDTLLVLDREVDMVSPLLSPLTYEGLVDDILGINNGKVKVSAELLGDEPAVNVRVCVCVCVCVRVLACVLPLYTFSPSPPLQPLTSPSAFTCARLSTML